MRFILGRSYVWIFFAIFLPLWIGGMVAIARVWMPPLTVAMLLPAMLLFILTSELRSGIALDSWWRAKYVRGTTLYRLLIAWHLVAMLAFSTLVILGWRYGWSLGPFHSHHAEVHQPAALRVTPQP